MWLALSQARSLSALRAYLLWMMASSWVTSAMPALMRPAHGGEAGDAFLVVAVLCGVGVADGFEVVLQVLHEVGGEVVGDERVSSVELFGVNGASDHCARVKLWND